MEIELKDIPKIDTINRAIQKVNHSLKSLTKSMAELKEVSPVIFEQIQEAIHKASEKK